MERIVYADYLRVIGIIFVIGVHLSLSYVSYPPAFSDLWFQGVISSSITRAGVLLFIMVSGLLLLDREEPLKKSTGTILFLVILLFYERCANRS